MITRVVGIGAVVVSLAVPAAAQEPPQDATASVTETAKFQMRVFEQNLGAAIERGAQRLVERARQVVPSVNLQLQARPVVNGVLLPEGAVFYAQIPGIEDVGLRLWEMYLRQAPRPIPPAPSANLPRMSNGSATVTTGGVVADDPLVAPLTDPSKEYTAFVRLALIDAMLDNALALPIAEGQFLTLVADELASQRPEPLAERSRKLILRLKGDDLIALRQQRITRDQAKQRLIESKY